MEIIFVLLVRKACDTSLHIIFLLGRILMIAQTWGFLSSSSLVSSKKSSPSIHQQPLKITPIFGGGGGGGGGVLELFNGFYETLLRYVDS